MKKLVILGDIANPHIQRWANYFIRRKYELHIISYRSGHIDGVHLHHVPPPQFLHISAITTLWPKIGYIFCLPKIRKLILSLDPDILHAHWATSYGLAGAYSGFHPFIISTWGKEITDSPKQSWIMKKIIKHVLYKADAITATSDMLAKETEKYVKSEKPVYRIPFGIDIKNFPINNNKTKNTQICIGTIKSLEDKYGIEYLIRAFAKVKDYENDIRLLIVGDGSLYSSLLNLSKNLGTMERSTFTGNVPYNEVVHFLHQIDIFVVPSISESETFGVSAVEASACGIPVIASNIGGLPEVVEDGETGMLVPARDIDALVDKILLLIRDKNLRTKLGINGRRYIESKYTLDKCGKMIEAVYSQIMQTSI